MTNTLEYSVAYYGKHHILVKGELQIFTIKGAKNQRWYCIVKIGKEPRIRKALGTTRRNDAERYAYDLYNGLRALHAEGMPIVATGWDKLTEKYKSERNYGNTTHHRLKMLTLFFTKVKDIKEIDAAMINRWVKWRKDYWLSPAGRKYIKQNGIVGGRHLTANIGATTLKLEATALKGILKFAFERGIIPFIPDIAPLTKRRSFKGDKTHRRSAFTNAQHARILKYLNDEYRKLNKQAAVKGSGYFHAKAKGLEYMLFPRQRNRRMYAWCMLLATSGIRPQEAKQLLFKDIQPYTDFTNDALLTEINISAAVAKTGEPRLIYVVDSGTTYRETRRSLLWDTMEEWRAMARYNDDDDYIFSNTNEMGAKYETANMGLYFSRMIKGFGKAGTKAENYKAFVKEDSKEFYSSYSYRHRFITESLKKGVSPYFISTHCGTSLTQIRKAYSKVIGIDLKDEFFEKNEEAKERREALMNRSVVELSRIV